MKMFSIAFLLFVLTSCSKRQELVKEEAKRESTLLQMTRQAQQHVGLQTTSVVFENLQEYLNVVGTVQPIDTRIGHVRPLARGRVQQVRVRVRPGAGG